MARTPRRANTDNIVKEILQAFVKADILPSSGLQMFLARHQKTSVEALKDDYTRYHAAAYGSTENPWDPLEPSTG
jgi:hypothetical protein